MQVRVGALNHALEWLAGPLAFPDRTTETGTSKSGHPIGPEPQVFDTFSYNSRALYGKKLRGAHVLEPSWVNRGQSPITPPSRWAYIASRRDEPKPNLGEMDTGGARFLHMRYHQNKSASGSKRAQDAVASFKGCGSVVPASFPRQGPASLCRVSSIVPLHPRR